MTPIIKETPKKEPHSSTFELGAQLRVGDRVKVKTRQEILATLDEKGTVQDVVFMPEMLEYCGKEFRVMRRADQIAIDGAHKCNDEAVREFKNNDVVILDKLRCSGLNHGGCSRGCHIFWKSIWLERIGDEEKEKTKEPMLDDKLETRLKTRQENGNYFCQSSELFKATVALSFTQRLLKCIQRVQEKDFGISILAHHIFTWTYWKSRNLLFGEIARGSKTRTPVEALNLRPGDLVEVKSLEEIRETLDSKAKNRGLHFSADMRVFCGKQYRVKCRTDHLIDEGTGLMLKFSNTVVLEDVLCDSSYYCFGECPRGDFQYWREIWLTKIE